MGLEALVSWTLAHFFSLAGLGLAFVLLAGLLRDRRPPGSAMAWFLVIALLPYIGVPLYLLLGQRKIRGGLPDADRLGERVPAEFGGGASDLERTITTLGVLPGHEGNRIQPLARGDQAFGWLMDLFGGATTSIEVSTFILGRDPVGRAFVERLAEKARAGVQVRLLLDAVGSLWSRGKFVEPLRKAGGQVGLFLPVLPLRKRWSAHLRNHRKLVVVDDSTAVIGGMNLAQDYMGPSADGDYWADFAAEVRGPVVDTIRGLFAQDWEFATGERMALSAPGGLPREGDARVQLVASGPNTLGSVMRDALLAALIEAERRVWIVTPYFIPDEPIAGVLSLLARQGKDVRVIVPANSNHPLADWARNPYLQDLSRAGGKVMLYRAGMLHAKLVLVDDCFVSIGSANLDMRSLYLNFEASLFVYDGATLGRVEEHIRGVLLPRCQPLGDLVQGGAWRGARDDLARILSPLL